MSDDKATYPIDETNRVKRRHDRGFYDHETVHALLDAAALAHVAYVIDGQPFCTPTLFWREGTRLFWHGSSASRMLRSQEDGLPVCVTVSHLDGLVLARCGFNHSVNYRSAVCFGTARIIDEPVEKTAALHAMIERFYPGRDEALRPSTTVAPSAVTSSGGQNVALPLPDLELGEYTVRVECDSGVELSKDVNASGSRVLPVDSVRGVMHRKTWTFPVQIVPNTVSIVKLIDDPGNRYKLTQSLGVQVLRAFPTSPEGAVSNDHAFLKIRLSYPALSAKAYLSSTITDADDPASTALHIQSIWLDASGPVGVNKILDTAELWGKYEGAFAAKKVDIVLLSDPMGAEKWLGGDSMLGLRITFKNVPVWDQAQPQPPLAHPDRVETFSALP